jgi:hypothetical protein
LSSGKPGKRSTGSCFDSAYGFDGHEKATAKENIPISALIVVRTAEDIWIQNTAAMYPSERD